MGKNFHTSRRRIMWKKLKKLVHELLATQGYAVVTVILPGLKVTKFS